MKNAVWMALVALAGCGPTILPTAKAKKVVVANGYSCALTTEGAVRCWGWSGEPDKNNGLGFFGAKENGYRVAVPVDVGVTGATDLSSYYQHLCVVTGQKTVQCWGDNRSGQLGDGTERSRPAASVVEGISTAKKVAVGSGHSCALLENGKVMCWGDNLSEQLGFAPMGSKTNSKVPVEVPFISNATDLFAGSSGTCAVVGGEALCWGAVNAATTTTTDPRKVPLAKVTHAYPWTSSLGCAITDGKAMCWGRAEGGYLGNDTDTGDPDALAPVQVTGMDKDVTDMSFACAIQRGLAKCWGRPGLFGNLLGNGTEDKSTTPVTVKNVTNAVQISSGGSESSCLVDADGAVWCWGNNLHGAIGDGAPVKTATEDFVLAPVKVLSFGK